MGKSYRTTRSKMQDFQIRVYHSTKLTKVRRLWLHIDALQKYIFAPENKVLE